MRLKLERERLTSTHAPHVMPSIRSSHLPEAPSCGVDTSEGAEDNATSPVVDMVRRKKLDMSDAVPTTTQDD